MTFPKRCPHGVFNACSDCRAERERRERIAVALLVGLLANPDHGLETEGYHILLADRSIRLADHLISKLDEKDLPS